MTSFAHAQAVDLDWSAPSECPDRQAVLDALQQHAPAGGTAVAMRARAEVVRSAGEYRLQLDLESRSGRAHRTLSQPQCTGLAEAAAVLIALALETEAAAATPEPEPPAQPEASPPPPAVKQTPSVPLPVSSSATDNSQVAGVPQTPGEPGDSALHLQLSASARADFGTLPQRPAWGMQAQLAARFARLYVALGASYWFPHEQGSASYPRARLSGSGLFSDLSLGVDATLQPISLTPLLNVELGRLDAQALGIAGPERKSTLWIAFGPGVSIAMTVLKDWTIGIELGGLVTAYRAHWLVRTPEANVPAFVSSNLVLRLALRIGYSLR